MEFLSALTGSFSHPAAGNPTVAMVEAAYRHHGLDYRYINCDVAQDALGDAVRGARAMGWRGFNLSIPHKVTVIDHIDSLAEAATIIGAVNCVRRDQGRLIGENTDGKGFVQSLDGIVRIPGKRVVVLGAGGAARAIAVEMALAGCGTGNPCQPSCCGNAAVPGAGSDPNPGASVGALRSGRRNKRW